MIVHIFKQQLKDMYFVFWIKVAGGLVSQDKLWSGQQGTADGNPLPLALGEISWVPVELVSYTHLFSEHVSTFPDITAQFKCSGNPVWMEYVIPHVKVIEKTKVLEDKTDVADTEITPGFVVLATYFNIIYADTPFSGSENTCYQVQQGGLA